MTPELERAFTEVADQFMVTDAARPGEWKCRLCGGETLPGGPVVHASDCALTVLHEALEAQP